MKKLMWIVCLLVVSVTAQAQFEKGKWIVNPLDFRTASLRKPSSGCRRKAVLSWWIMWH